MDSERFYLTDIKIKMPTVVMKIQKIRIITIPNIKDGGFVPRYQVFCKYFEYYNSKHHLDYEYISDKPHFDFVPTFKQ